MLSLCSCCRAEHNFPGPGKRRMQVCGFRYWQQSQMHNPSSKASTKANKKPQPKPLPNCRTQLEERTVCTRTLPSW